MRVETGSDRGPPERDLAEPLESRADTVVALAHLRRIAAELLSERDGHGIHQMRSTGLDHVVELGRLRLKRVRQTLQRRQEIVRDLVECREVHCRGKDVVRRLTHVHVVVRMDVFAGQGGDDLVRVHVRRCAGARLEDVDRKLIVELTRGDAVSGLRDPLRLLFLEEPQLCVDARRCSLDASEPAGDGQWNRFA